ncbi:MAG TPA: hypothetical protein DGH68_10420 [Bacteroidetes bacterium]|nr:hypothetical protein [Bacteroidota bacterium]
MQKKILVVDDDPLYLDLVRDVFAGQDIEIVSATTGAEALSLLKTQVPSLIISDFEMPGINGIEFHSQLQKEERSRDIPFVFMTGSADQSLTRYVQQLKIRVFSKNNLTHELFRLLNEVL